MDHLVIVKSYLCRTVAVSGINSGLVLRGYMFYVCPQTWLNETRTNIGLSPTVGFLNENDNLAYFAILGELSSSLSFTAGFF